ncbi:tetratricopeptide repeat protein [Archangium sp.]|uniref:tetratricopeptide repeat protein n=1 Tax=Archangium sp. TaxID=1872627 RepID=UPI00286B7F2F|nr:tetratricopeptide repeat protein [Archangium sp.]
MFRPILLVLLVLSSLAFAQAEEELPTSYDCPLQGLKDGRLSVTPPGAVALFDGEKRLASTSIPDFDFNPNKGDAACEGTQITLSYQVPFKTTTRTAKLTWKDGALQQASASAGGASSAQTLAEAEKALKAGHIEAALTKLETISYPQQSYDTYDMAARLLKRAHEVATKQYKAKDKAGAAKVMELAFRYFSTYAQAPDGRETLPAARLTAIRNDYGFFLAEAGRSAEAEQVLRQVVEEAPERAVARLNLADALWAQGKKAEAEAQYREYSKRIPRKKWPATLLQRCPGCASTP